MDEEYKDYLDNGFAPLPKGKGRPFVFIIDDSKTEQGPNPIMAADICQDGSFVAAVKGKQEIVIINTEQLLDGNLSDKDVKPRTISIKLKAKESYIMDIFLYSDH